MSWGGGDARLGLLVLGSRARSSGGVLGVALYTERRAARAGVMAADLGTSVLARAACPGGSRCCSWLGWLCGFGPLS